MGLELQGTRQGVEVGSADITQGGVGDTEGIKPTGCKSCGGERFAAATLSWSREVPVGC